MRLGSPASRGRITALALLAAPLALTAQAAPPTPPPHDAPAGTGESAPVHTVVIDPGHGGHNHGAMGFNGVLEKYVTIRIAERLAAQLAHRPDLRVLLTRSDDRHLGLRERARWADAQGADLFLSLHANAATHDRAHGIETYFLTAEAWAEERAERRSAEWGDPAGDDAALARALREDGAHRLSGWLAEAIHGELVRASGAQDRGVKQADFTVLRQARCPAVVLELGFLTHPVEGERLLLAAYQEQLAEAIARGLQTYVDAVFPKSAHAPGERLTGRVPPSSATARQTPSPGG